MTGLLDAKELAKTANRLQEEVIVAGLVPPAVNPVPTEPLLDRFDTIVTSQSLRSASRALFANAHYARAVEEAYKCLNNAVKSKSGLSSADGDALMRTAFSPKAPFLRLNRLKTRTEKDEQQGYMEIYAGAMMGIRNPRAHEHGLEDKPDVALEMLVLANHLMRRLELAKKSRSRKATVGGSL